MQEACKLNLTVSDYVDDKRDVFLDLAAAVMEAAQDLINLNILVRSFLCLANPVCCMFPRSNKCCTRSLSANLWILLLAALFVLHYSRGI